MKSTISIDRRELLAILGGAAVTACAPGAPPVSAAAPAPVPPSGSQKASGVRAVLAPYVERGEVPGVVAAVLRDNKEQSFDVLGSKAAGTGAAMERDSIFRVASLSKPVTAVAAMMLVEAGKLSLDEPVDRLLPELARRKVLARLESPLDDVVPAKRAITVRDLLTFRMGFGMVLAAPGTYPVQKAADDLKLGQGKPAPQTPPAPDEWLRRFAMLPLMHQPGEKWMYHTGADVLGVLIARASGQAFDVFLRERLFGPLGMHDTDFSVPVDKLPRFTTSYLANPQTGALELYDAPDGQWSRPPAFPSGGGGLVSTVPDFLQFSRFMLGRGTLGGARLLSPESIQLMTSDALTPDNKAQGGLVPGFFDRHSWTLGMSVVTAKDELDRNPGTYGWDGGLGTAWYADPTTNSAGILFSQRSSTSPEPPPMFKDFWRAKARG
jgi:CubicO group peptidase (beta-lactamase class C family)